MRFGNSFRPSLLPEKWKRVDNLLLALLANGYSRSRIKATLEKLNLPYSEASVDELVNLIYNHLQFSKETPLDEEMLAVFIDAYRAKLRDENGKVTDASIFVAVGIDMEAHKMALGWWVKYTYTTNVVESINAVLELMRMELGLLSIGGQSIYSAEQFKRLMDA